MLQQYHDNLDIEELEKEMNEVSKRKPLITQIAGKFYFKERGYIQDMFPVTIKEAKELLRNGEPVNVCAYGINWEETKKPPFNASFKDTNKPF